MCLGVRFNIFLNGSLPLGLFFFYLNCFLVGLLVVMVVVDGGQWLGRKGRWLVVLVTIDFDVSD